MSVKKKPEARSQEPAGRRSRVTPCWVFVLVLASGSWLLAPSSAAAPSQEEVFRSIQQNVGSRPGQDGDKSFAFLVAGAGALILVLLIASRVRVRQAAPRKIQHAGKLLREVSKTVGLKPKELKQLKALAEETRRDGSAEPVENPLTLLLCPSLLARTLKDRPGKVDRAVVAQLVRRMGVGK